MPPMAGSTPDLEKRFGVGPPKAVDPYASFPASVVRPTEGFIDLRKGLIKMLGSVENVVAKDVSKNAFMGGLISIGHDLLLFGMFDGATQPGKHHDGVIKLGPEAVELAAQLLRILDVGADDMAGMDMAERYMANDVETSAIIGLRCGAPHNMDYPPTRWP